MKGKISRKNSFPYPILIHRDKIIIIIRAFDIIRDDFIFPLRSLTIVHKYIYIQYTMIIIFVSMILAILCKIRFLFLAVIFNRLTRINILGDFFFFLLYATSLVNFLGKKIFPHKRLRVKLIFLNYSTVIS